jgi:putative transposase
MEFYPWASEAFGGLLGMRKHTPDEIVTALQSIDGLLQQGKPAAEAAQTAGVSTVTYYRWRKQYGGLSGDQAGWMTQLRAENARLRRTVSELGLDRLILLEAIQHGMPTSVLRRELVDHVLVALGISERRACRVLGQHRSTQRKKPKLLHNGHSGHDHPAGVFPGPGLR